MALKDYVVPTRDIELSGGVSFTVRGLSLPQVTHLVTQHAEAVRSLFDRAKLDAGKLSLAEMESIGTTVLLSSPELAAEIIAIASGEEDAIETIRELPFPVTVAALEAIGRLTFDANGGPKNFVETVLRIAQGVVSLLAELRQSKTGSLQSGGR